MANYEADFAAALRPYSNADETGGFVRFAYLASASRRLLLAMWQLGPGLECAPRALARAFLKQSEPEDLSPATVCGAALPSYLDLAVVSKCEVYQQIPGAWFTGSRAPILPAWKQPSPVESVAQPALAYFWTPRSKRKPGIGSPREGLELDKYLCNYFGILNKGSTYCTRF